MVAFSFPLDTVIGDSPLVITEIKEAAKFVNGARVEGEIDGYRARVIIFKNNLADISIKAEKISDDLSKLNNDKIAELNNNGKYVIVSVTGGTVKPYIKKSKDGSEVRQEYSVKADLISLAK
jgi:hypothetical protein